MLGWIVVFGDYCSQTQQFIPTSTKTLLNAKLRAAHERGTCDLKFWVYGKSETLNGWRCFDEKIKWMKNLDEKTDQGKRDMSNQGINRVLI